MPENNYLIKFKKGDFEIEVQGDREFVEEKFYDLLSQQSKYIPKDEKKKEVLNDAEEEITAEEFLSTFNPRNHCDEILTFAYFLETIKGISAFNIEDIEKCYNNAGLPVIQNFIPYLTTLLRDEYLVEKEEKKDNKKAMTLTKSGVSYVEALK